MDRGAHAGPPDEPAVTPEQLADLQAGLLDDETAARVRRAARTDPASARLLAGLDAVRGELARLGSPGTPAGDVPAAVTARIGAALRATPPPRHQSARPVLSRTQRAGLVVGIGAAATAAVLGYLTLTRPAAPVFPPGPTASHITVSTTGSSSSSTPPAQTPTPASTHAQR